MNKTIVKIRGDGTVAVEAIKDDVKSFKEITPDSLLECIIKSLLRGSICSGLLPKNCISFTSYDNGDRDVVLLHAESKANVSYFGSEYKDLPLPRLVFGFRITKEGRVTSCRLGVIANDEIIKPNTKMYYYPLSNVSGFALCTGSNVLPKCTSLCTLTSLPYYIISMPNNNDHFKPANNKLGYEMRDLLELLKDKQPEYYYSDVLILSGAVLNDFISGN